MVYPILYFKHKHVSMSWLKLNFWFEMEQNVLIIEQNINYWVQNGRKKQLHFLHMYNACYFLFFIIYIFCVTILFHVTFFSL